MSTKQIKIEYQVQNLSDNLNNITDQLGSTTVFSGSLAETGPVFQSEGASESFAELVVDYDVVDWNNDEFYVTTPVSIAVNGGLFMVDLIQTNYNINVTNTGTAEAPVWQLSAGTAVDFKTCSITSQPLWNGVADTARYNHAVNQELNWGPGQVLSKTGETVVFDINICKFNDHYPL